METGQPQGQWKTAYAGLALAMLLVSSLLGWHSEHPALVLGLWLLLALLLGLAYRLLERHERSARDGQAQAAAALISLAQARATQESRSDDLALLGRYGNLLLGCLDLAEVLQTSEQMLSLMLPSSAGTIYPLIDGEGLAEATHLWGVHSAETQLQASADDCHCMKLRRTYLASGSEPASLCAHFANRPGLAALTACIPLIAQGKSLGWMTLSSPPAETFPKLQLAGAAADQLALALANLKLRQNLRDLSVRDPLTSLFNRRYLSESLGREMSRSKRRNLPLAVMAFDLDHFKDFNDRFGHAAGDAVLVAFAKLLQSMSRSEDIACRQGGEEFVLIMPEMEQQVALRRATELMASMAAMEVMHEGHRLPQLTTSIGIAIFPDNASLPDELLAQADQALYEAKSRGRNRAIVSSARPAA